MKLIKIFLPWMNVQVQAFIYLPETPRLDLFAIFTHGYTSDKSSVMPWAYKLMEINIASICFDLPGHYNGSFNEVDRFEDFKLKAHELFRNAEKVLMETLKATFGKEIDFNRARLILGGHSLGALLALKALSNRSDFHPYQVVYALGVGLGLAPKQVVHIFDTPLFKATMIYRAQLVSKALHPDLVFPWIKEEKLHLNFQDQVVHLICGEDDVVVGTNGAHELKAMLESCRNTVTLDSPRNLPHHKPEEAAVFIKKWIQSI